MRKTIFITLIILLAAAVSWAGQPFVTGGGGAAANLDGSTAWTGAPVPDSAGGQNIGTTSAEWGHIYLHNSKSIYFQADQSLYLTGGAGVLTLTGGNFVPGAATLTLGSTTAEWGGLYLGDSKVIYGQADQSNTITSSATGWTFNLPITTQSAKLTGGTNTFNITNGTAVFDVAAGATLNIDKSLQVATGAVVINGNAGGSSVLGLPNQTVNLTTMTNGKLCGYNSTGTAIECDKDATGGTPTSITVADEAADTSSFPLFVTAATGDLGPKTNAALTFNAATGALGATSFTGSVTGTASGNIANTLTSAKGDMIVASGANTPARLAHPGAANYVLTTNATDTVAWANTLNVSSITSGGIILGDTTPDADGEIGYASNAYLWFANGQDWKITSSTNLWTFASNNASATFAFTPSLALNGGATVANVNAAGGSASQIALSGTLGAMDGSGDYFRGIYGNWTNANHSAGNVYGIDLQLNAGDAEAVERAINISANWDYGIYTASPMLITSTNKIEFGDTGTYINQVSDGVLGITSDTEVRIVVSDEDIKFTDGGTNIVEIGTNTGVTTIKSTLSFVTTGNISGKIPMITKSNDYTLGTDDAQEAYGYMVWMSGATKTLTLPAVAAGMSVCVYSTDANEKRVDPNANDRIRLNGTAGSDGKYIKSAGAAGNFVCLVADSADGWTTLGASGTWVSE